MDKVRRLSSQKLLGLPRGMHIQVGWQLGHPTSAETQRQDGENARSWARTGTIWHILTPEQWNMNEVTTVHVDWLVIIGYYRGYTLIHGFTPWFIDVYCISLWPNWEPWLEPTSGLVNYAGMMIIGLRDLVLFSSLPQWHKHIYTISTPGWVKTIPNGS